MSTCAGVLILENLCGLCNNCEIPPPLKLIALDLNETPSFCLSCSNAR